VQEKHVKLGPLKHSIRVTASSILNNVLKVSTFSCHEGNAGDKLLGSCFLPLRLPKAFRDFLRKVLPELLQEVDLQTGIHLRFMYGGSLPNFYLAVREFLNKVLLEQRIGRIRPVAGPARYPELNP
jgi:hypothetical protein